MDTKLLVLSAQQLRRAALIREQIGSLEAELDGIVGLVSPPAPAPAPAPASTLAGVATGRRLRKQISARGLANIRAAQRARWARAKALAAVGSPAASTRGGMSRAAKAKLSTAMKRT